MHTMTRLLLVADRIGASDPDVAWLIPAWIYKAAIFFL